MTGIAGSTGMPFSPWQALQTSAFCSIVSAPEADGPSATVAAMTAALPKHARTSPQLRNWQKRHDHAGPTVHNNSPHDIWRRGRSPPAIDREGDDVVAALVVEL